MTSERKYDCKWFPACEMDCGDGFCSVFWGWKMEAFRTIKAKNFQWFKELNVQAWATIIIKKIRTLVNFYEEFK